MLTIDKNRKLVIGMVHLLPLPGNPAYRGDRETIEKWAIEDAHTLIDSGVDAIMVENFNDGPQYSTEIPLSSYSLMLSIVAKIRDFCKLPLGVNIEMNAFEQEWMMAYATHADFTRIEAFVDNRAGSFGFIEAASTPLAQLMKDYPSDTALLTDVRTAETYGCPEVPINELAQNARNHDSSAVIVTENDHGNHVTVDGVKSMREVMGDFPIIVGAGVHPDNVLDYLKFADGVIVGRGFQKGDRVDPELVTSFMKLVNDAYRK